MRSFILILLSAAGLCPAQDSAFTLGLSANGSGAPTAYRGQPLLLETHLLLEDANPLTLALRDDAPWTSAVTLRLTAPDGAVIDLPWSRLQPVSGPMAFTPEAPELTGLFGLDPAVTQDLPPGRYTLTAALDTRQLAAEGSWKGLVRATPLVLTVADEPAELDAPARSLKARLRARWLQLDNRPEEALAELDQVQTIDALLDKADLLVELSRPEEAQAALETALQAFRRQNPASTHPPRSILRRLAALAAY
jgi:hypothetical protein